MAPTARTAGGKSCVWAWKPRLDGRASIYPGRQGSYLRGVALAGRTSVEAPLSLFRADHRARGTPWPGTLERRP